MFFVLSGFVISHSLFRYRMNLNLLGRFTLRRSLRLDPPYWIAIAISLAFGALAVAVVKGRAPEEHPLGQLVAHVFYLQDILGYGNINPVFWTLCMEIQFYLVYAILLALGRNNPEARFQGRRTASLLLFAGLLSLLWPLGIGPNLPQGLFPPLWHGFLLGVGAYWAWRDRGLVPWFTVYALFIGAPSIVNGDWFSLVCVLTAATLLSVGIAGSTSECVELAMASISRHHLILPLLNSQSHHRRYFSGRLHDHGSKRVFGGALVVRLHRRLHNVCVGDVVGSGEAKRPASPKS